MSSNLKGCSIKKCRRGGETPHTEKKRGRGSAEGPPLFYGCLMCLKCTKMGSFVKRGGLSFKRVWGFSTRKKRGGGVRKTKKKISEGGGLPLTFFNGLSRRERKTRGSTPLGYSWVIESFEPTTCQIEQWHNVSSDLLKWEKALKKIPLSITLTETVNLLLRSLSWTMILSIFGCKVYPHKIFRIFHFCPFQACKESILHILDQSNTVNTVLELLQSLIPTVSESYQKESPIGSTAKAQRALDQLKTHPKSVETTDQLMVSNN